MPPIITPYHCKEIIYYSKKSKSNEIMIINVDNDSKKIHHEKTLSGSPLDKKKDTIAYNNNLNKRYKNINNISNVSLSIPRKNEKVKVSDSSVAIDVTNLIKKIDSNIIQSLESFKSEKYGSKHTNNNISFEEEKKNWIVNEYQRQVSLIINNTLKKTHYPNLNCNDKKTIKKIIYKNFNIEAKENIPEPIFPKKIRAIILRDKIVSDFIYKNRLFSTDKMKDSDPDNLITSIINERMFQHYFTHTTVEQVKQTSKIIIEKYIDKKKAIIDIDEMNQKNKLKVTEGEIELLLDETHDLIAHNTPTYIIPKRPNLGDKPKLSKINRNEKIITASNYILTSNYP